MKKIFCNMFGYILILIALICLAGCKQMIDRPEESAAKEASASHMASESPGQPSENMSAPFTGTVVETIDASRYTYVLVETGEKKIWVAAPAFDGSPGDAVSVPAGLPMADFKSKTLDREFEMIYFVGAIHREGEIDSESKMQEMPKDHPPVNNRQDLPEDHPPLGGTAEEQMTHPPMSGFSDSPVIAIGTIEKAENGKTVSEIINGRENLAGKTIRVRAKVVKFTPDIMEKNWLHVRDGSGEEGTNDLIVTTDAVVNVGDLVLVSGVVLVDRDFGYGLKYRVIIENAEVTRE